MLNSPILKSINKFLGGSFFRKGPQTGSTCRTTLVSWAPDCRLARLCHCRGWLMRKSCDCLYGAVYGRSTFSLPACMFERSRCTQGTLPCPPIHCALPFPACSYHEL